jgi:hypothetical protein
MCRRLGAERSKMTQVREDQFDVTENCVVHRPTRAEFWANPGMPTVHRWIWGRAGEVLANGDNFDGGDVLRVATKLVAERPRLKT